MITYLEISVALLGWLTSLALLAAAAAFIYVLRELFKILDWLREFAKMYLGVEIETEKKSPAAGFVKMERPWDEDQDGRD